MSTVHLHARSAEQVLKFLADTKYSFEKLVILGVVQTAKGGRFLQSPKQYLSSCTDRGVVHLGTFQSLS